MSLVLQPRAQVTPRQIAELEKALAMFYQQPPSDYYQLANESAGRYSPAELPFHHDLIQHVRPGMAVLELGCGTAHLCSYVQKQGGVYTGVDYSDGLLNENRQRLPGARFLKVGEPLMDKFDMVVSLYAIEHVVDPPAYLDQLWNYCRPGGMIGIICPEFIDSPGLPPSVFYGRTPGRFREKLRALNLIDAAQHLLELKIQGLKAKHRLQASPAGSFWINLQPVILNGGTYVIDADAVHLVGLRDLVWYYELKGAEMMENSGRMTGIPAQVRQFNTYILVRKPGS